MYITKEELKQLCCLLLHYRSELLNWEESNSDTTYQDLRENSEDTRWLLYLAKQIKEQKDIEKIQVFSS